MFITHCEGSRLFPIEQEEEECSPGDNCLAVERAGKVRALSIYH